MKKISDDIIKFKTFIIYKRKKTLKYGIFTYNKISKLRSIKYKETFMPLFFYLSAINYPSIKKGR